MSKYQISHKKYLQRDEVKRLVSCLDRNFKKEPSKVLLIYLALHTGARAQELLNCAYEDINTTTKAIYIRGLKGSRDRELPLPKWLFLELFKLFDGPKEAATGRIFPFSYSYLYKIWQEYKPTKNKSFHSLRHTFALNVYAKTRDLRLVQVALGHTNVQNTMIYADYYYSIHEMRQKLVDSEWRWAKRNQS